MFLAFNSVPADPISIDIANPQHSCYSLQKPDTPGQCICSNELCILLTQCLTHPNLQPPCPDHFPILCTLDTVTAQSPISPRLNWRQVDWDKFHQHLTQQLANHQPPSEITTSEEFSNRLTDLTTAINTTVAAIVPFNNPSPYAKRWWTKELSQAHSAMRCTARSVNKVNNDPTHPSHREYKLQRNTYTNLIRTTKQKHWTEWLEEANVSGFSFMFPFPLFVLIM